MIFLNKDRDNIYERLLQFLFFLSDKKLFK